MNFRFYNTLSRKVEPLEPLTPGHVNMYNCGPTVYGYLHMGNTRNLVVFDALRRVLATQYQVTFVRNITDVDDKIINRAKEENVSWEQIASTYTQAYEEDCASLGLLAPDRSPKATEHIQQMIDVIRALVQQNVAYATPDGVYYRVTARPEYGKLSGRKLEELQAGARIEVDEQKEYPMDFALWKAAKPGEPSWPSPWGAGRPGWHIECSAMALAYLGETFDIHTGGSDLIFPHHENEIAQSEAATGKPMAKYWLHNGMLEFQGAKMSKSVGNIMDLREVLKITPAAVVRYFLLSAHYRSSLDYGPTSMASAKSALEELTNTFYRLKEVCGNAPVSGHANPLSPEFVRTSRMKFLEALANDFNTPEAFGHLFGIARAAKRVLADPAFVLTQPAQMSLRSALNVMYECTSLLNLAPVMNDIPVEIVMLLQQREEARKKKEFASADHIRKQLLDQGIHVEDTPAGPIPIRKAK